MVAYNFQSRFALAVEDGTKRQTIRALGRRRHAKPGEMLQLYTGQRTKQCRLLREDRCHEVWPVLMTPRNLQSGIIVARVSVADVPLSISNICALSRADGFACVADFFDFFRSRLPFEGVLIKW
ncbi:MAG: hypothetical protein AAGI44_05900 [Pseudomonadota bacterium]